MRWEIRLVFYMGSRGSAASWAFNLLAMICIALVVYWHFCAVFILLLLSISKIAMEWKYKYYLNNFLNSVTAFQFVIVPSSGFLRLRELFISLDNLFFTNEWEVQFKFADAFQDVIQVLSVGNHQIDTTSKVSSKGYYCVPCLSISCDSLSAFQGFARDRI